MKFIDVITGVQHIGIPTNDLDQTRAFYESLGFTLALETVNEAAKERVAFLTLGNLTIETYENGSSTGKSGAIDHIALDVTDIQAAFSLAKNAGLTLLTKEIQSLPFWEKGVEFFIIEGPNGERIEFCQKL